MVKQPIKVVSSVAKNTLTQMSVRLQTNSVGSVVRVDTLHSYVSNETTMETVLNIEVVQAEVQSIKVVMVMLDTLEDLVMVLVVLVMVQIVAVVMAVEVVIHRI